MPNHQVQSGLDDLLVSVKKLKGYPGNARRGDVAAITDSLKRNGQYRPIVAQTSTGHVLVGNHTLQAAKKLGWTHIAAVYVDVDDKSAARINVADNQTAAAGTDDGNALLELIGTLDDLEGTGWDDATIDLVRVGVESDDLFPKVSTPHDGKLGSKDEIRLSVGRIGLKLSTKDFNEWAEQHQNTDPKEREAQFRTALELETVWVAPPRETTSNTIEESVNKDIGIGTLNVPIETLKLFPGNARRGDIPTIAESLRHNQQYKPIVVQQSTNHVLAGNHTLQAAKKLGWTEIAAVFVDVDDHEAKRILLGDNRIAALGGYDHEALALQLSEFDSFDGTGYKPEDASALLETFGHDPLEETGVQATIQYTTKVVVLIGPWSLTTTREAYEEWEEARRNEYGPNLRIYCEWVATRLELPAMWEPWQMKGKS
jgi:ParB-like chromosome segregation protein Spo0J